MTGEQPHTGPAGTGRLLSVDGENEAVLERNDEVFVQHLYKGMRAACLGPDPRDPSRAVISIEGGIVDAEGELPDSVLFTLSADALDSFAEQIRETAFATRLSIAFHGRGDDAQA